MWFLRYLSPERESILSSSPWCARIVTQKNYKLHRFVSKRVITIILSPLNTSRSASFQSVGINVLPLVPLGFFNLPMLGDALISSSPPWAHPEKYRRNRQASSRHRFIEDNVNANACIEIVCNVLKSSMQNALHSIRLSKTYCAYLCIYLFAIINTKTITIHMSHIVIDKSVKWITWFTKNW